MHKPLWGVGLQSTELFFFCSLVTGLLNYVSLLLLTLLFMTSLAIGTS